MTIGDMYLVKAIQSFSTAEELQNTFFYMHMSGAPANPADDLADAFLANVWESIDNIIPAEVMLTELWAINVRSPGDFAMLTPAHAGEAAFSGAVLPPFICSSFRSAPPPPGGRYSYHRFPVPHSGCIDPGTSFGTTMQTNMGNLLPALAAGLTGSDGGYYLPVQVASGWSYGTLPTFNRYLTGGWSFNIYPGTQNSRKGVFYLWNDGS